MLNRPTLRVTVALAAVAATAVVTASPAAAAPRNRISKVTATVYETGPCPQARMWTTVKLVKRSGIHTLTTDLYAGERYLGSRSVAIDVEPRATKVDFNTCLPFTVARKKNLRVTIGALSPNDYHWRTVKVTHSGDC